MYIMTTSQIEQGELHIWCVNLRDFDVVAPALRSVLSDWEQARAERFRFLRDRNNYIISHGILRMLLGNYAGHSPTDLNITLGTFGKPELRNSPGGNEIHFNLSHSGDMVLYGVTGACPIGVDLEFVRPIPECERIAKEFFSQAETESLMALPEGSRTELFFDIWTRKEALLKAKGVGLGSGEMGRSLSQAETVVPHPKEPSKSFRFSTEWYVRSFSPVPGYVASVAFRNPDLDLICRGTPSFFSGELCRPGWAIPQNHTGI
jgi:4'-phosphopantetheinyl transferase